MRRPKSRVSYIDGVRIYDEWNKVDENQITMLYPKFKEMLDKMEARMWEDAIIRGQ